MQSRKGDSKEEGMTLNRTSIDYHHISSKERKYLEMIEGVRRLKLKDIVKGEELAEGSCGTIFESKIRDETGIRRRRCLLADTCLLYIL